MSSQKVLVSPHSIRHALLSTQNPENLLVFAAGNSGDLERNCTVGTPATSKNVLSVGASSSGETRLTSTGADGEARNDTNGSADLDTVAVFSSYGPTKDNRIKPEILAPGDAVSTLGIC